MVVCSSEVDIDSPVNGRREISSVDAAGACSEAVLDADVARSVAMLFLCSFVPCLSKPAALGNGFPGMEAQGGLSSQYARCSTPQGLLDARANTLLTKGAHVSSKRMRTSGSFFHKPSLTYKLQEFSNNAQRGALVNTRFAQSTCKNPSAATLCLGNNTK